MPTADILERQHAQLTALASLLSHERTLLVSSAPDGDALAETAAQKARSFGMLESLEGELAAYQQELGLPQGPEGRRAAAQSEGCQTVLQGVLETAARVFRLNEMNGELVNARLGWNERLLNFIREAQDNWMYTPSGKMGLRRSTTKSWV